MQPEFPGSSNLDGAQKIGTGGSGVVYSAHHPSWGKVAVKVALNHDPQIDKLFASEYTLLRSLRNSAILQAFDYFRLADGRAVIVTQLCEGGSFEQKAASLPPRERIRLIAPVLSAIEYLHLLGLIHRDLKDDNILIHNSEGPKLSDLGLAATNSSDNKERGGTIEYMAPEVIDNQGATAESDIYSLGMILYKLAMDGLPFSDSDPMAIISRKREPNSLPFDDVASKISARFAKLVRQCIDPEPAERPKSMKEIIEQLSYDNLLQSGDCRVSTFDEQFHHHLYSYNAGFARQELKAVAQDVQIIHHHQGPSANIKHAFADRLRLEGYVVLEQESSLEINHPGRGARFALTLLNDREENFQNSVDYPELDQFAFKAMLGKIFTRDLDPATTKLLYELSSGNIAIVQALMHQLESQNQLELQAGRLHLSALDLALFSPDDNYFELLRFMCPAVPDKLENAASLLALDTGQFPLGNLVATETVNQAEIEGLVSTGILSPETYAFRRSYFRHHLRHEMAPAAAKAGHLKWIRILAEHEEIEPHLKERLHFHHFSLAGNSIDAANAALRLAELLTDEQQNEGASTIIEQALLLPDITGDTHLHVMLLMKRAQLANLRGDLNCALTAFSAVIRRARRIDRHDLVAAAYKRLGDVYKAKRDYRRGNRALDSALKYFREIGDELELSYCYNNLGNLHWIDGDLDAAASSYTSALEIQRRLGVLKAIASSLSNLGSLRCIQQNYEEGIRQFVESIQIKKQLNDLPELARTYNNLSVAYFEQDELVTAQEYLKQSSDINRKIGAEAELLYNYDNFYEIEFRRGNFDRAKEWLMESLRLASRDNNSARGITTTLLANLFLIEGRYNKADTLLAVASERESLVTDWNLSMSLAAVSSDYSRLLMDFEAAYNHIETAIELARSTGQPKSEAVYLLRRAQIERSLRQDVATVTKTIQDAEDILANLVVKRTKLDLLIEKTELARYNGDLDTALRSLSAATAFPDFDGMSTFRPRLYLLRGELDQERGDLKGATVLLNDCVLAAKSLGIPELVWQGLLALGESYSRQNQIEKSLKSYIEAFSVVRGLAGTIRDTRLKKLYLSDKKKRQLAKRLEEMSSLVA